MRIPGLDHPITIQPADELVTVRSGAHAVAETSAALRLDEAGHDPVYYIPMGDVDQSALERSDRHTYCPFKGTASYYHVRAGADLIENAIWTYEQPYPAVRQIAGHVACYPSKLEVQVRAAHGR